MSAFDWTKESLLVRGNGEGESYHVPAASSWGKGHSMTQEEAESWCNVCEERLRRASIAAMREAHWDMVGQKWANYMGKGKWVGAEQPPDMQWETCFWFVCGWLKEFDCLWLQLRPEIEIVAGLPEGALRCVAGELGLELDVSDLESDLGSEDAGEGVGGLGLNEGLAGWSHDRGARMVTRRADFGVARNQFGVSAGGSRSNGMGGVGTVGAVPMPGLGGRCRWSLRFP